MKKLYKTTALVLISASILFTSCFFDFEGERKPVSKEYVELGKYFAVTVDEHSYEAYGENYFAGKVISRSDEAGIHIDVTLDESEKYDLITLYSLNGCEETEIAWIKPVEKRYHFMNDENVPRGDSIFEGDTTTETEVEINSSYKTNYLDAKTYTFDLLFIEPGKSYTFFVGIREIEGFKKNVTNGFTGKCRRITFKNGDTMDDYGYLSFILNHFVDAFTVTASSTYKAPKINASYNKETDEYKFEHTAFVGKELPFNPVSEDDVSFSVGIKYQVSEENKESAFNLDYENKAEGAIYNLSEKLEAIKESKYDTPYIITDSVATLSYKDHFGKNYSECTTEAQITDYYKTLYSLVSYSYAETSFESDSLPNNICIPDNRMKLNVKATENGNVISFNLLSDASSISIYNSEDDKHAIGEMSGKFKAETEYSFTDYLATPAKTVTYYLKWNARTSSEGSVKTLDSLKYYPKKAVSTFDNETMIYEITENPFKDCLPENFNGKMDITYETKKEVPLSIQIYDDSIEYNFLSESYDKDFSGKILTLKNECEVGLKGVVNGITYTNRNKIDSTFDFVKKITLKNNYIPQPGENQDYDDDGNDNHENPYEKVENVDIDFNTLNSSKKEKWLLQYYKDNCPYTPVIDDNALKDMPEITALTETADGIEISMYIPSWLKYFSVIRYSEEGNSTFNYKVEKCKSGNIKLMDYNVSKNTNYSYRISFDGYQKNSYWGWWSLEQSISSLSVAITAEHDSPYMISNFPAVTTEEKAVSIEYDYLKWNKLPVGYKEIAEYDNSIVPLQRYYKKLKGKNNSEITMEYYDVAAPNQSDVYMDRSYSATERITYFCYEVDNSELYFKDETGNTVNRTFSDEELTYHFYHEVGKNGFITWKKNDFNSTGNSFVKGKYKVIKASTCLLNEDGMWSYSQVNVLPEVTNSTFEIK